MVTSHSTNSSNMTELKKLQLTALGLILLLIFVILGLTVKLGEGTGCGKMLHHSNKSSLVECGGELIHTTGVDRFSYEQGDEVCFKVKNYLMQSTYYVYQAAPIDSLR